MKKEDLKLYFIMGSQDATRDPRMILQDAIKGGVTCFQFREKGPGCASGAAKVKLAQDLRRICLENGIPFIVNDDVELALTLDADGIHVGQDDMDIHEVIERCKDMWVGLSVTSVQEAISAPLLSIDYLGVGPIYQTSTKKDAKSPIGLDGLREIRNNVKTFPVVAIGGINASNLKEVVEAGADGGSFISSITAYDDATKAARELYNAIM